uniref:Putative secreted protein n=1 Tax=Ixodes ricinus TaxID=34613 RepID=A0A6B0V0X0_IXORI
MTAHNPFVFIVQILVTLLLSPADCQAEIRDQRGFSRGSVIANAENATLKNSNHGQEAFAFLDFIATLHYPPTASSTASAQGAFPRDIKGARQLDLLRGHGGLVNMTAHNPFVFIVQERIPSRRTIIPVPPALQWPHRPSRTRHCRPAAAHPFGRPPSPRTGSCLSRGKPVFLEKHDSPEPARGCRC